MVELHGPETILEDVGFRPGKKCTGQILNMCEHIEDRYENELLTRPVFVDLAAAYDSVNKRNKEPKLLKLAEDCHLITSIAEYLSKPRFFCVIVPTRKQTEKKEKMVFPREAHLCF